MKLSMLSQWEEEEEEGGWRLSVVWVSSLQQKLVHFIVVTRAWKTAPQPEDPCQNGKDQTIPHVKHRVSAAALVKIGMVQVWNET